LKTQRLIAVLLLAWAAMSTAYAALQPASGEVMEAEADFSDASPHGLPLVRHYRSSANVEAGLGRNWSHNWAATATRTDTNAVVRFGDGSKVLFDRVGGTWKAHNPREQLLDTAEGLAYLRSADETRWQFDAAGRLASITERNGWRAALAYDSAGRLQTVTNAFGRRLQFAYDAGGRIERVTFPDGSAASYGFDAAGRVAFARAPDGTTRQYAYDNPAWPQALTGIAQDGARIVGYGYDLAGRADTMQMAGVATAMKVSYPPATGTSGTVVPGTSVDPALYVLRLSKTDALGNTVEEVWQGGDGRIRLQGASSVLGGGVAATTYDAQNLPVAQTDHAGVQRTTQWDSARQLPLAVTEAANQSEARTTQTTWHPTFRLPVFVNEPGRTSAYAYDALGNLVSETVTDTASGEARTTRWEWGANNLPSAMTDAKGGTWRYGYDTAGNRTSVKDPLGQQTTYVFDGAGRVLKQTDPNGLVTSYAYDLRGRLVSQLRGTEASSYTYSAAGLLASASLPNGYSVSYTYDAAQRLIAASDNHGAVIRYTLDAAGNRVREEVQDAAGTIALATGRVINALNQISAIQGAGGQATKLTYDANGEVVAEADPLNQTTRLTLDALRRPTATTFADNTAAAQSWSALDQLTAVTDPKGVQTTYATNAFGEVMRESSPDIGSVSFVRDANGDVVQTTDAKGQVTRVERDALGRPTQIRYHGGSVTSLAYDAGGRVSQIEDSSGRTVYTRDAHGRVLTKTVTVHDNPANPSAFQVSYGYTNGDLTSITYPSGLKVRYQRSAGRITGVDVLEPGKGKAWVPFVSNLTHTPLGQPKSWSWFNGDTASRTFDADGRMTANEFARYTYDAAGRMVGITQDLWASRTVTVGTTTTTELYKAPITWTAGYDSRNRLVSFERAGAKSLYTYDANSNRLTAIETQGSDVDLEGTFDQPNLAQSASQQLKIEPTSNRLLGFTQTLVKTQNGQPVSTTNSSVSYSVDDNGAMTSDGLRSFVYDDMNRLAKVEIDKDGEAAAVRYLHNALGQRVFKSEVEVAQTLPDEDRLGNGFVNWLRKNFGWMFAKGNGARTSLGQAVIYAEDGMPTWAPLGEYDNGSAAGTATKEYIWLPIQGEALLIGVRLKGKLFSVHTDQVGSPRLVFDATIQPVWQWPLSPFGNNAATGPLDTIAINTAAVLRATRPAQDFGFGFPGQAIDRESGLNIGLWRDYCPLCARFTQADPLGLAGGLNRFTYAAELPLQTVDPYGLFGILDLIPADAPAQSMGKAYAALAAYLVGAISGDQYLQQEAMQQLVCRRQQSLEALGALLSGGRAGRQARLKDLANDPKLGSADRGWLQQEINSVARGQRSSIRNPPGKDLAHERGREAAKGYDYKHANLQDRDLHKMQHKFDNFGRANAERPPLQGAGYSGAASQCGCP
jgi:RHS repeat-associated protein